MMMMKRSTIVLLLTEYHRFISKHYHIFALNQNALFCHEYMLKEVCASHTLYHRITR